ncbi:Bug family tripartite tricarboxylate transporter substrate binding protein [Pollutimonas bauzanensis]|uniref:Tripartite-type tricarboxylate transporter, receptor component TctC n=1 Tax=Pollutimonas bauzanensis TaxID=658167 RepID=A0A1M5Z9J1_9BURK|nr:tripartite tricarboxylate transporter substrate binding protein [Pollutimonas bauzanensis]SHI20897.1 Tripartite-type tricarboxylate transporter, receptor component TctC [Pollutimonas bauzanensis]
MKKYLKAFALLAMITAAMPGHADSADYPARPIRLIVPYPAGGITDIVGRTIAERISATLAQPVIVENRAGAGGSIGAAMAAGSAPDGYTLFLGTSATNGTNPSTYANLKYRPATDFSPIALIASAPLMIIVHPSLPAKTLPEFIEYLKANPKKVTYATTGTGGSVHLTTEQFAMMTGTEMVHVPYKGSTPALTDLMGGHIQVMFDNVPSAAPLARSGKVRALAVTGAKRSALAPEIPTVSETAVPGFDSSSWIAIYAPAGVPAGIAAKLNAAVNKGLQNPALLETFNKAGLEARGGTPADLAAHQAMEIEKWAHVVKSIGYEPQ